MSGLRAYGAARSAASPQVIDRPTPNSTPIEDAASMIILANHPPARADGDAYELICVCGSRAGALDIDG